MAKARTHEAPAARWLLLIHQLPPKPAYFRVKVGRHLGRLGAVALKNSVYVLPATEQAREDFVWVYREIVDGGGDASVCAAQFFEGFRDDQIEELFHAARNDDYEELAVEARLIRKTLPRRGAVPEAQRPELEASAARLKKRLDEIAAIDFFGASMRETAEGLVTGLAVRLDEPGQSGATSVAASTRAEDVRGRMWVTRKEIRVDRIACAWLVRRSIDAEARFKFVTGKGYVPEAGELRFDMFEAEFTHEGDRCTFEVLLDRFGLRDPALRAIGEIVHDIDLKDAKFRRPETPGVERLLAGIAVARNDDEVRLARGSALFDDLLGAFEQAH